MKTSSILVAALMVAAGCAKQPAGREAAFLDDPAVLASALEVVTDAMVGAVTSPPVASRTYAYASIAAYEVLRHNHAEQRSLAGQLNGLEAVPVPVPDARYSLPLASVVAYLTTSERLVFAPKPVAA